MFIIFFFQLNTLLFKFYEKNEHVNSAVRSIFFIWYLLITYLRSVSMVPLKNVLIIFYFICGFDT